jgi:hypothetical protein
MAPRGAPQPRRRQQQLRETQLEAARRARRTLPPACVLALLLLWSTCTVGFDVPQVEHVWPARAGAQGGAAVRVSGSYFTAVYNRANVGLGCKFGSHVVAAWFVNRDIVECRAPAHAEGFVRVELTVNNETAAGLSPPEGVGVQYYAPATVASLWPTAGVASTLVTVRGTNFLPGSVCHFGAGVTVTAAVDSSALLRCEAPSALSPGVVVVSVSNVGDDSMASASADVAHEFVLLDGPAVLQLSPVSGPACGGTHTQLQVSGFTAASDTRCRFGPVAVRASAAPDDTYLSCTAPAMAPRFLPRPVHTTVGDTAASCQSTLLFRHTPPLHTVAVAPDVAASFGGAAVELHLDVLPWFSSAACQLGARTLLPARLWDWAARCTLPASSAGFVVLRLVADAPDTFASSSAQLLFVPQATVIAVTPASAPPWGGGVSRLLGVHLRSGMLCSFGGGSAPSPGQWISSALLLCELPPLLPGGVRADIVHDGAEWNEQGAVKAEFVCEEPALAAHLEQVTGTPNGGTPVLLLGALWMDGAALECGFGTIWPVQGVRTGAAESRCISPAHAVATVPVQLNRRQQRLPDSSMPYAYVLDASLFSVQYGPGATFLVSGDGFPPSEALTCNLCGGPLVQGIVRDSRTAVCTAPPWLGDAFVVQVMLSTFELLAQAPELVEYAFAEPSPALLHAQPPVACVQGGSLVTVLGTHLSRTTRCLFGESPPLLGSFVSTALVVCETPAHAAAPADVRLAGASGQLSQSLTGFAFEPWPTLSSMQPSRGTTSGGTVINVNVESKPRDDVFCAFGTVTFVRVTWLSGSALACTSVAHAPATAPFMLIVAGGAAVFASTPIHFVFYDPPGFAVLGPAEVLMPAASVISLAWDVRVPGGVACSTGQRFASPGRITPASSFCEVSPGDTGFFVVDLMFEQSSGGEQFQLLAVRTPRATMLFPEQTLSVGSMLLSVHGSDLVLDDLLCLYDGATAVPAVHVSSVLAVCETPEQLPADAVTLHLVSGSSHRFEAALTLRALPVIGIVVVTPAVSSTTGGASLSFFAAEASLERVLFCQVGTIFPITVSLDKAGVHCVAPAHAAAVLPIALASNIRELEFTVSHLSYVLQPALLDATPSEAWLDGDTEVALRFDVFLQNSLIRCIFDAAFCTTTQTGADFLLCSSPAHTAGFAAVLLQVGEGSSEVSDQVFLYRQHATVFSLAPIAGPTGGGTMLHVSGAHFSEVGAVCIFGVDGAIRMPAQFVSSVHIRCQTPPRSPGHDTVEVDELAGVARGSNTRQPPHFEFLPDATILSSQPERGDTNGGTAVVVVCTVSQTHCRFGSIAPVFGRVQGSDELVCVSPAHVDGSVRLSATVNVNAWASSSASFEYLHAPAPWAYLMPEHGGTAGGDAVRLWVAEHLTPGLNWQCVFGTLAVRAQLTTDCATRPRVQVARFSVSNGGGCGGIGNIFSCMSPAHSAGVVALTLESDASEYVFGTQYEYVAQAFTAAVLPLAGPSTGGTVVTISGNHFSALSDVSCSFGTIPGGGASFVSSALMQCETPAHAVGPTPVAVVTSRNAAPAFTFFVLTVAAVSPASGPESGGTVVEMAGSGFADSEFLACRFGSTFPVAASWKSAYVIQCVSPAMYPEAAAGVQFPRAVPVFASGNQADCATADTLYFEYQPSVHVAAATPRSGIHLGQTPVFVIGAGFVNSTALACRFGLSTVLATYLSYANVLCIAPAQAAGPVFLEVTNNGDDFTTDRLVFFYGTCRNGHYCPAGEPLPCPRGAYCAGTANFNFTVCAPGTYQPQIGQAGCLPAPVGFIAPDFGTVYPRLCPRGSVCDVMGLSSSTLPCPPGHFCLDGTRTANFTDFRVAERPLPCPFGFFCGPGVSSSKSIANNFTTPQPCYAGYLCEPGSITPQGSGPCPSGHYCPPGQLIPCPPRTYCPNVANTEPKPCLPGTYNEEHGRATCKQCPRGTVCPGFARDLPEACPPGYVCDQAGLPLPTARCPAGHFCLANTVTADPLAPLDEEQLLRASPIALNTSNFRPQPCSPGTYCLEGVGNSTTAEGVYFNPQPCNAGSYCEWGTSDRTVQGSAGTTDISIPKLPCPAGSYCPTGTFIPIPAPRGSFASGTGNAQAALCLPGSYTHYEGFQRCLACPAGYECRKDGTYKPVICDAGKFRSSRDSITCVSCPVGTWSPYKGLTDEALCLPCNAGLVCGVDGMTNSKPYGDSVQKVLNGQIRACETTPDDATCFYITLQPLGQAALCPEGYVCDARTTIAADKCPDGYYCGYGTTPETQFANPCPAGYFCPAGTSASGRLQFPCIACFYCEEGTGLILRRCPEGTESSGSAKSIDDCTADQITFWRVQPLKTALVARTTALATGANATDDNATDSSTSMLDANSGGLDANSTDLKSSSTALEDAYAAFGRCTPDDFDGLLPSFVLDTATLEQVQDIEGVPLVYFQVPRNYVVKMQFDFRNVSSELVYGEHYEVAIFTGDYSTQSTCPADEFKKAVPCPPWNNGDGINKATMGVYADRLYEEKCPRSTNGLELPFWFARNGLFGQVENNVAEPASGTFVDKKGLMELNLLANDDLQFRVEVRLLHGRYQADARRSFLDTMCVDLIGPRRGSSQANSSFHIILPRNDAYQLPLNIPLRTAVHQSVAAGYESTECNSVDPLPTCRYVRPESTLSFNSSYASEFMLADRYWLRRQAAAAALAAASNSTSAVNASATTASDTPTSYSAYLTTVPDVIALEGDIAQDASQYWKGGDPFLAVDFLPFFSSCRGFDANVVLYQVLQTAWTGVDIEGAYKVAYGEGCTLVPEDDTKFINQWAPQIFTPVADTCSLEFTCLYQESYSSAAAVPRWFEAGGDDLFYLTREPQPRERLFEATVLASDQTTPTKDLSFYSQALDADGLMAVSFGPASGSPQPGSVPKTATLSMTYFPYSARDKRIISAAVELDGYQTASTHDGTYTLGIVLEPLGWFDLLNAFAFDTLFYSALFVAIGLLADLLMYAFWGFCRMFTRLRDPPRFKSWALLSLMVEPQVTGLVLAMMPFYVAELGVQQLMLRVEFLTTFPGNIDNLDVSLADEATVNGRVGLFFLVIAIHGLYCTSLVLIPDRPKSDADGLLDADGEDDDGEGRMDPVRWQRTHFMAGAMLMAIPDLFLAEFSVGNTYGVYLYPCWFMMKIYHMGLQALMSGFVVDEQLFGAICGINETMETIITIAAGTFTEFALAYYLDVMYTCIEDLFLGEAIDSVSAQLPVLIFQLEKLYYRVRKRTITEQLLHAAEEEEDSQVEALIGFICGYGPATTGLTTIPFLLYYIWDFNAQLQYTSLWGVTRPDLLLYVLFVTVMIPFQWFMDMFRFNAQEVFQGWKVYEYLKYARYRFRNRTARWKGLETQFDESIDAALRTSDQMCFSNQWYFTLGLGASSGTLFVLAVQILLRAQCNPFGDVLFFLIILIAGIGCVLGRKGALALANLVNLWRIRNANDADDALFADEELPSNMRREPQTGRVDGDAGLRITTVGDLTSADITSDAFRRTFLDANRLWLLDQLGELLTPRTARRVRGAAGLSSDDDSDVASLAAEGRTVNLSEESAFVMRQWMATARARVPGRLGRSLPIMTTDEEEDDARFPPVALTQTASSLLAGWLAASRAIRAAAPAAGALSSNDSGSSSSNDRFPAVQVGLSTQLAARIWLQRARQVRRSDGRSPPSTTHDTSSDSSDGISSDSSERVPGAPPPLTTRARAVALTWLSLVRMRRAVSGMGL